jgi:serine protease Do
LWKIRELLKDLLYLLAKQYKFKYHRAPPMSSVFRSLFAVLLASSTVVTLSAPSFSAPQRKTPPPLTGEENARQIYKQVLPSVVTVLLGNGGHGSGFVVSRDGLIITNAHVTEDAVKVVTVKFADGSTAPADVIGFSKNRQDLSLIKVNSRRNMPFLTLAPVNSIQVGSRVYAIGSPLAVDNANTFTQGDVIRIDKKTNYVIHTALINHGNSGGPLVNTRGQVVGVNTRGYFEGASPVTGADGQQIGQVYTESGQQGSVNVAEIREFLSEYKSGKISRVSTRKDPAPADVASAQNRKPKQIAMDGRKVTGMLSKDNYQLTGGDYKGSYFDIYSFDGKSGQTIDVNLNSTDFNTLLALMPTKNGQATGEPIAINDDIGPKNLNSRIVFQLPSDGTYVILVVGKQRGEKGKYQLSGAIR